MYTRQEAACTVVVPRISEIDAAMDCSASILVWVWVIEALASCDAVPPSAILDLLESAPVIPAGLARNAREMISLRILEVYVARQNGSRDGASSRPDVNIEIDQSRSCEDVARRLMQEILAPNVKMDNSEMLKWDIGTFIRRRRASFPKCTLQRLKDAILGGNNPGLSSLVGKSGLSIRNKSARGDVDAVTGILEGSCCGDQTIAASELMRDDTDSNTNDLAGQCDEDHVSMEIRHGPRLRSSKKLKVGASFSGQDIGQKYGLRICSEHSGDLVRKNGQRAVSLATSTQIGGLGENRHSEDGHDQHFEASRMPGQGNDDGGLQDNHPRIPFDNNVKHNPGGEIPSDSDGFQDEEIDTATKEHAFLSSKCTFSEDYWTAAECPEFNLCIKCDRGGQLLVCSASDCPILVHQRCLGSAPAFDDSGNFYCPVCAYSRAVSEYHEAKKKSALTRKALSDFISCGFER